MSLDAFLLRSDRLKSLVAERNNLEAERLRQSARVDELAARIADLDNRIEEAWKVIQSDVMATQSARVR